MKRKRPNGNQAIAIYRGYAERRDDTETLTERFAPGQKIENVVIDNVNDGLRRET